MRCPICLSQAENLTPNTLDGVVIGCSCCGNYRISGGSLHELMGLQLDKRIAALDVARVACRHGWPIINGACIRAR